MPLSQHDHMVQAFPPDGADQSLGKPVLPWAAGCCDHFSDAHFSNAVLEPFAIDPIMVSDQVPWSTIFWKRLPNLLSSPSSRRMLSDVEVNHTAPAVR